MHVRAVRVPLISIFVFEKKKKQNVTKLLKKTSPTTNGQTFLKEFQYIQMNLKRAKNQHTNASYGSHIHRKKIHTITHTHTDREKKHIYIAIVCKLRSQTFNKR